MVHRMQYLIWMMSEASRHLMQYPHSKYLMDLIAMRARLPGSNVNDGLEVGEARIGVGDFACFGGSKGSYSRRYRTACKRLTDFGLVTMRTTKSGTIAKILNSEVYDILRMFRDEHSDNEKTKERQTRDDDVTNKRQLTENKKKELIENKKKGKDPETFFLECMEEEKYKPLDTPSFRTAYVVWIEYRKERKPALTTHGVTCDLNNALKVGVDDFRAWSAEAIERGYRGWFFSDRKGNQQKTGPGPDSEKSDDVFTRRPARS